MIELGDYSEELMTAVDDRPLVLVMPTLPEYGAAAAGLPSGTGFDLQVCGMGAARAAAFCRRLAARTRPLGGLALIGWAGGLSPELTAGDIVVADAALDTGGRRVPCAAISLPGTRVGLLLTVPAPLLTPASKAAHWSASGALAVEMEAYPLAAWAWAQGLPFIHARVILDPAGEALPDLAGALDPLGRVLPGRLARRLLAQPSLAVPLLRFVRRARALAPVLGGLARGIVEAWPARAGR